MFVWPPPLFWADDLVCSCGLQLSSSRTEYLSQVKRDKSETGPAQCYWHAECTPSATRWHPLQAVVTREAVRICPPAYNSMLPFSEANECPALGTCGSSKEPAVQRDRGGETRLGCVGLLTNLSGLQRRVWDRLGLCNSEYYLMNPS